MKKLFATLLLISPLYAAPLKLVTSFTILEDIAHNVGGEEVEIKSLITHDKNAHGFEPSPSDLVIINSADALILNGLQFEPWLERIIHANQYSGTVVIASQGVPTIRNREEHHDHGEFDPHIWQNPLNVIQMAKNIKEALSNLKPEKAPLFEENFLQFRDQLLALDKETEEQLSKIPKEKLNFLILHNSFQYLTERYGVQFTPILGLNPLAEPSAKALAQLYRSVKEKNIDAIFTENIATSRFIQTLADDLGIQNGGILYSDALTNSPESDTYIKIFQSNIQSILKAATQKE